MKYIFTGKTKKIKGVTLKQIMAMKDFDDVKIGTIGGWIEEEENLSHEGNCWVYENAEVYGCARIYQHAKIRDYVNVFEDAEIFGSAEISGNANIKGSASISGFAKVFGSCWIYDDVKIFGSAEISGQASMYNKAKAYGNAKIFSNSIVFGEAEIFGNAQICKNAKIAKTNHYICLQCLGDKNTAITVFRDKNNSYLICFEIFLDIFVGNLENFRDYIKEVYGIKKYEEEYYYICQFIKKRIESWE